MDSLSCLLLIHLSDLASPNRPIRPLACSAVVAPELGAALVIVVSLGVAVGPDLKTAYVTLSGTGRLAKAEWPRPGLKLAH